MGIGEWHGQPFSPRCPPADLLVWLVREVNSGGIWEGNHRDVAVRGGSVPGVYRASEVSRGELRPLHAHGRHPLRVMKSSLEMASIVA
jgi:hypothetical protein